MNTNIRCKQMFGKKYRQQRSWDLFSYLARDIAKDIKITLKTKHFEDKEWKNILREIYWCFDQIEKDYPLSPWNINWEKYWNEYGKYREFEDWCEERDGHTYYKNDDRFVLPDKELEKQYYDRIQRGLDSFVENFVKIVKMDKRFYHYPEKIANDLRAFKMYNIHGVPHDFVQDGIDKCSIEEAEKLTDVGMEKWHDAVDKMYQAFDNISKGIYIKENNDGLALFSKHFANLWD